MNFEKEIEKLNQKKADSTNQGLEEKQHQKGKLTARERLNLLLDENSFLEIKSFAESRFTEQELGKNKFINDSVITGFGKVNGRPVYVYSQDFTKIGVS